MTVCATEVLILSSELIAGVLPHATNNNRNSPKKPILSNLPDMVSSFSSSHHKFIIQTSSPFLTPGIFIALIKKCCQCHVDKEIRIVYH